uniref:Uncharacterized protein n=1 Tax=Tanacetum cinerariifolium TaxID=118510 RepID=A0A6L2NWC2_TANCI|nr:hypothetical protein [Tanacetum cinerariifolium]
MGYLAIQTLKWLPLGAEFGYKMCAFRGRNGWVWVLKQGLKPVRLDAEMGGGGLEAEMGGFGAEIGVFRSFSC